jgi:hypothetical protein
LKNFQILTLALLFKSLRVIRRTGNKKRGTGRPNLTWEESVEIYLKD